MRNLPILSTRRRALAVAGICFTLAGCYWLRYYDLATTHVELMEGMATDTADALEAGLYEPRASEIERLRYPLMRARQFAQVSAGWGRTEHSARKFLRFLDSYEEFVESVDRSRIDGVSPEEQREILARVAAVVDDGWAVRVCVACERDASSERCSRCGASRAPVR
jgi:hypothetical protein